MNQPKLPKKNAFKAWQHYITFICERMGNADMKEGLKEQVEMIGNHKMLEFDFVSDVSLLHTNVSKSVKWDQVPVVCFKDIKCKYRPHLYFGDYYLMIADRGSDFAYYFLSKRVNPDKSVSWENAQHPHISGGNPCLGHFAGDMHTAADAGNIYQFLAVTRKYLEKYNGNSVFTRGTRYKPEDFQYKMVSETDFWEEYGNDDNIDYDGIMRDATRWSFPREMAGIGNFSLSGLDRCSYQRSMHGTLGSRGIPYSSSPVSQSHPSTIDQKHCVIGADWYCPQAIDSGFYNGYCYWVSVLLECSILDAQFYVNRYFNGLYAKFKGVKDRDQEKLIRGIYREWWTFMMKPANPRIPPSTYPIHFGEDLGFPINGTRQTQSNWQNDADQCKTRIRIPKNLLDEVKPLYADLKSRFGSTGMHNTDHSTSHFTMLVKAPNKMASKIVAVTRNNKPLEELDYKKLMGQEVPKDITEECVFVADKIRAHVLEEYHTNLSKEKGRVLNEWKEISPKSTRVQSDDWGEPGEQASLFSDTL